jgi:epoxide hydrolase-like predicted phosphatase
MAKSTYHLIKAVIWDLGGVLVRTVDRTPRTELAEQLGMTYTELDQAVFNSPSAKQATLGLISADQHWIQVCQDLNWPVENLSEFQRLFWGGDRLDEGLVDYIRRLKPAFKTGLLSNNWSNLRHLVETRWQIGDAFDRLVISAELGLIKPEPPIYRFTLDQLDVRPDEAIFVDDFIENIEAARKLGWQTVHFQSPTQALTELNAILQAPADRDSLENQRD